MSSITAVTPTICRLFGIEAPAVAQGQPLPLVARTAYDIVGRGRVDRMLMFAPDALGLRFLEARPGLLGRIRQAAPLSCELRAVLPAKTPICFASMFTGSQPEVHGIRTLERPVLKTDTVFDALLRSGFRVAIIAVEGSSIDRIFRERDIDYFSEKYDPGVVERTLELISADRHDFILSYVQEYDDTLHVTTHDGAEAESAAERHVAQFERLSAQIEQHWSQYHRALAFVPDHGAHTVNSQGTHGDDIPEDTELLHFWRISPGIPTAETALRAWNSAAEAWDDFVQSGNDWYRLEVHGPALLRACGDVRGLKVLDLGCGQGYFSRQLARVGAKVTGVDFSENQVASARKYETGDPLGIEYLVMDAAKVDKHWPHPVFDLVTAAYSIGDMPDAEAVFRAAYRVLKPGCRMAFSDAHPCTDPPFREWERDEQGRKLSLKIDRYFETGPGYCFWNMPRLKYHWNAPVWRRTIEELCTAIANAGFLIRHIAEPRPTPEQVTRGPDLEDCYRLPYTLVFQLVKQEDAESGP
ncbi:MAG: methyltransferase domain-containing protein [candidate division WOR-3 bacterium]|nr:MAG: methyltransferase domain-containing protein [candidate division WOR-3 bacterium]